jgi:hypothetical protein
MEDDSVGGGVGRLTFPVAPSGFSAFQRAATAERVLLWRVADPNPLVPLSARCCSGCTGSVLSALRTHGLL